VADLAPPVGDGAALVVGEGGARRPARVLHRRWVLLTIIGVVALAVRLLVVVVVLPECPLAERSLTLADSCYRAGGDVRYFRDQAEFLAGGDGFLNPAGREGAQHPPAFTLVLAGLDLLGISSVQGQRLVLALLGSCTAVVLAALVWSMVGRRGRVPALVAGLGAAGYPMLWLNDVTLFSESLLALLVALAIWAWFGVLRRPAAGSAALFGLALGLCALTRAECLLVAIPFALMVLRLAVPWGRRLLVGGVAALVVVAVVSPWLVYNQSRFEGRVLFASTPWLTIRFTACDDVFYGGRLGYYSLACGQDIALNDGREADLDARSKDLSLAYLDDNLARWPVQMVASVARAAGIWRPLENVQIDAYVEGRGYAPSLAGLGWYYALVGFALVGAVALRRRRVPLTPVLSWAIPVLVAVALGGGVVRYRVPIEVGLVVLAAIGFGRVAGVLPDTMAWSRPTRDGDPSPDPTSGAGGSVAGDPGRGGAADVATAEDRDTMAPCPPSSAVDATDSA